MAPITITAFDAGIDLQLRGLRTLKAILTKASSHNAAATLPSTKLFNDTVTLAFHIQSCLELATSSQELLTRNQVQQGTPTWTTTTTKENTTIDELIVLVDKTIALLEAKNAKLNLRGDTINGNDALVQDGEEVQVTYGNGQKAAWDGGKKYILGYIIPNLMFHLCMVYAQLRGQGVDVGKMDFLVPFMVGRAPGF